jgi:FixJ family two-component response regulator
MGTLRTIPGPDHDEQAIIDRLLATLSRREREVFTHVIAGRLNKQIANDLQIAEKTVKVHRGRMMVKLGVRGIVDLVRFALKAGLLPEYHLPRHHTLDQWAIEPGRIAMQA